MIKRPGNESYLRKVIEVERKAFCEVLEDEVESQTGSESDSEQ